MGAADTVAFIPLGLIECPSAPVTPYPEPVQQPAAAGCKSVSIEIILPNGVRVSVDAFFGVKALSQVLRAMKGVT